MKTTKKKTDLLIKPLAISRRLSKQTDLINPKTILIVVCCLLKNANIRRPFVVAVSLVQLKFTTVLFRLCLLKVVFRSLYVSFEKRTDKKERKLFLEPDSAVETSYPFAA